MRVLVTGGAGFIGSHTVDLLLAKGYGVRVLDGLVPPVHAAKIPPEYVPRQVDFVCGDVRDRATWQRALSGIEAVFHLAAYQDYLPDFSTFIHTNSVSTALLYEVVIAERLPVHKVVVASSQAVYGEGKYRCRAKCGADPNGALSGAIRFPPMREERQLIQCEWELKCPECGAFMTPEASDEAGVNPHNSYAISKYAQEMIALSLGRRYGVPTVCLRYSIVQGARQSFRNAYSGILRIFTQRLLHGNAPVCFEDGQQLRDYVSVHDVARANALVLEDDRADFGTFNVGGSHRKTVLEYARLVAKRAGIEIEPEIPGLYRVGDVRHIVSDITKLCALGWTPVVSLEDIVDEYISWARSERDLHDYSPQAETHMRAVGTIRRTASRLGAD